jgi:hypothetical protein
LTGTRSETHMRQDLQIFEFALTRMELDTVSELF